MFTRLLFTLLSCTCIFLIGCAQTPPVDTRADVDALRSMEAQWLAATKARDIDKIVSLYSPDIVIMDANVPLSVGHKALSKAYESWLTDTLISKTLLDEIDAVEVSSSGDLAYTRGTSRYSRNTQKGLVDCSDKWVTIYKKIDGKWRAIVDIGNSNKPLPAL